MGAEFSAFFANSGSGTSGLVIGGGSATPISGGQAGRLLYDTGTTIGETTGWTTDGANALTGGASTTLAVGGAAIGPNAVSVTGSVAISSTLTVTGFISSSAGVSAGATSSIFWNGRGILSSPAAGSIRFGSLDAASPVAQTVGAQGVVVGTSNTNAPAITWQSPQSTGTGTPGGHVFQSSPAGSSGASQNAFVTSATIGGPTYHISIAAGTIARSQINFASSAAPTSPNNGDFWFDGTNVKIQVGGTTKTFTLV